MSSVVAFPISTNKLHIVFTSLASTY